MKRRHILATLAAGAALTTGAVLTFAQPLTVFQPDQGDLALPLVVSGQPTGVINPNPSVTNTTLPREPSATATSEPTATATSEPTATPTATPTSEPPPVIPPEDFVSERLVVPAGYEVRAFYTSDLNRPRLMTIGPDGWLYVADRNNNRVVRIPDWDNNGIGDSIEVIVSGIGAAHSVEWYEGQLYVAVNDKVLRFTDLNSDGDMMDSGEREDIVTGIPNDGGHSTRTARIGPDGKLYVAVGSKCNIPTNSCAEGDPRRAAILRYNLDGTIPADNPFANDGDERRRPVWAEGLRNSVDFVFLPDGRMLATHNGRDNYNDPALTPEENQNLPPEEVVIGVIGGRHHGWPYCYTPLIPGAPEGVGAVPPTLAEVDDNDPNMRRDDVTPVGSCNAAVPALFTALSHVAPLGIAHDAAGAMGGELAGSLLIAYHGSWNADFQPRDCRVEAVTMVNGQPTEAIPFLSGFRDNASQECGTAWGRPAGITFAPNGAIYVSDDKRNAIYRIVYVGQ